MVNTFIEKNATGVTHCVMPVAFFEREYFFFAYISDGLSFAIMTAHFQCPNGVICFRNSAASAILAIRFRKYIIIAELVSYPIAYTIFYHIIFSCFIM